MERWRIILVNRKSGVVKIHNAINVRFGNLFIWVLPSVADDEIPYRLSKWNCKGIVRVTEVDNTYKPINEAGFIC